VFKVTVNLTSEKWDKSLATGKSNRKSDLLILKIQFGVSKTMMLGYLYILENVSRYVSSFNTVRNFKPFILHQIGAGIANYPGSKKRETYRNLL